MPWKAFGNLRHFQFNTNSDIFQLHSLAYEKALKYENKIHKLNPVRIIKAAMAIKPRYAFNLIAFETQSQISFQLACRKPQICKQGKINSTNKQFQAY